MNISPSVVLYHLWAFDLLLPLGEANSVQSKIGLRMCSRNQYIFLPPPPLSLADFACGHALGTDTGSLVCRTSAGSKQPFPPSPALSLLSTIVFPFWVFRALLAEGRVGGWQHWAVCMEVEKSRVGGPRCGWEHCYVGPFEGGRNFSFLGLREVELLGCACPLPLSRT